MYNNSPLYLSTLGCNPHPAVSTSKDALSLDVILHPVMDPSSRHVLHAPVSPWICSCCPSSRCGPYNSPHPAVAPASQKCFHIQMSSPHPVCTLPLQVCAPFICGQYLRSVINSRLWPLPTHTLPSPSPAVAPSSHLQLLEVHPRPRFGPSSSDELHDPRCSPRPAASPHWCSAISPLPPPQPLPAPPAAAPPIPAVPPS